MNHVLLKMEQCWFVRHSNKLERFFWHCSSNDQQVFHRLYQLSCPVLIFNIMLLGRDTGEVFHSDIIDTPLISDM